MQRLREASMIHGLKKSRNLGHPPADFSLTGSHVQGGNFYDMRNYSQMSEEHSGPL